jgi:hypothetical protein
MQGSHDRMHDRMHDRSADSGTSTSTMGNRDCPPGLAKKDNGCLPPGQARKLNRDAQR